MTNKKPPFDITSQIIKDVTGIAELVGRISTTRELSVNPMLRRTNRIRTIYSSLAIEQNTLSLEQVTAVLDGKRVIAPPGDIAEVKNAYEIYERLDMLDPYSMDSLLMAHGVMMRGLVDEAGEFRSRPVGVVDQSGQILHFGTLPPYVPGLIQELLDWVKSSDIHMIIKSCVFHYEFELIHPFADGNGRIGRLWHTLLLSKWNPLFAWLPVESIIHDRQKEYYDAINASNSAGSSTEFIQFMLSSILAALSEVDNITEHRGSAADTKAERQWGLICAFLRSNDYIANGDVQKLLKVSSPTANRILNRLVAEGKLHRVHVKGHWAYCNLF